MNRRSGSFFTTKSGWPDRANRKSITLIFLSLTLNCLLKSTSAKYIETNIGTLTCECENGTPETTCDNSQSIQADCQSCNPGYTLISYTDIVVTDDDYYATKYCKLTSELSDCQCDNGIPKRHCYGSEPSMLLCESCNNGFILEYGDEQQNTNLVETYYKEEKCEEKVICNEPTSSPECHICGDFLHGPDDQTEGKKHYCTQNQCSCTNGTSIEGTDCVAHQSEFCVDCKPNYHIENSTNPDTGNSERHCILNKCTCEFGQPVVDDCEEHNKEQCTPFCNDFYSINGTTNICVKNVCYCDHGEPEIDECVKTNGAQCKSCHSSDSEGYFELNPSNNLCEAISCSCENGTPANGNSANSTNFNLCKTKGANLCAACDDFYHQNQSNTTCLANECTCENGTGAGECRIHNGKNCLKCDDFYHLEDEEGPSACLPNICSCEFGTAVPSSSCSDHGTEMCQPDSCQDFYHYDQSTQACKPNICLPCQNGRPAGTGACKLHNSAQCEVGSCAENYHMYDLGPDDYSCKLNRCHCENGIAIAQDPNAVEFLCKQHNSTYCGSCSEFFKLEQPVQNPPSDEELYPYCVPNDCTCDKGQPNVLSCYADGIEDCGSCDLYYGLVGEKLYLNQDSSSSRLTPTDPADAESISIKVCKKNECTCRNGQSPTDCPVSKDDDIAQEYCVECDDMYFLNKTSNTCQENECICDNGTPAASSICTQNGMVYCLHDTCHDSFVYEEESKNCIHLSNACYCNDGVEAGEDECLVDGIEACMECDNGYVLASTDVTWKTHKESITEESQKWRIKEDATEYELSKPVTTGRII